MISWTHCREGCWCSSLRTAGPCSAEASLRTPRSWYQPQKNRRPLQTLRDGTFALMGEIWQQDRTMTAETYLKHGGKSGLACWSGCSARSSACTCRSYSRIKHSSGQVPFEVLNWVHRDEHSDRKMVAVFVKFSSEPTCCSTTGNISGFLLLRFM